ncbi:MAG: hypothetical protein P4L42_05525 [Desulfocapsaceae bacterium]|nr:hypothetical protein [Desulfocapsaceae bacterium]
MKLPTLNFRCVTVFTPILSIFFLSHFFLAEAQGPPPETGTVILTHPHKKTTSTKALFTFSSTKTGTFECKIDSGSYADCRSPVRYGGLSAGPHTFSVESRDAFGSKDLKPAVYTWTVTSEPDTGTTQLLEEDYLLLMP